MPAADVQLEPDLTVAAVLAPACACVQTVLQESLRLSPPGWMTTREALADITLNGLFIPKGGVVYIDIHGIQRSPKYWQQPTQFMPERFLDKVVGGADGCQEGRRVFACCICGCFNQSCNMQPCPAR
jgi:cytochrome P450